MTGPRHPISDDDWAEHFANDDAEYVEPLLSRGCTALLLFAVLAAAPILMVVVHRIALRS